MTSTKKPRKPSPTSRRARAITRYNNSEYYQVMKNALAYVEGKSPRGKLSRWIREASLNYKPTKRIVK